MNATAEDYKVDGVVQSLARPEDRFGLTYHALMIPPFRPDTLLVLGWGDGTVGKLIDRFWGKIQVVVGVDVKLPASENMPAVGGAFVKENASVFVGSPGHIIYDYVALDLYEGKKIPEFVFYDHFVKELARMTGKMLAVNCSFYDMQDFACYTKYFNIVARKMVEGDKVILLSPYRTIH